MLSKGHTDFAIHIDGLGKSYEINRKPMTDRLVSFFSSRKDESDRTPTEETFWSLKGVSFDVSYGDVIGVIGRNGAGKSTLLKILSRITAPTEGDVFIGGSVTSLLEVGTGFHPELTGRENVFLNGSILGMSRKQIQTRFDEIVDFAGIHRFIDTPVKRYSSGMYVRLAFAVAAHLDSRILLVDEVLAVGDALFQKKCLGKLDVMGQQNRTVLFVSHSLLMIRSICSRVIVLEEGRVTFNGPTEKGLNFYIKSLHGTQSLKGRNLPDRLNRTTGDVTFTSFRMVDENGNERWSYRMGESLRLEIRWQSHIEVPGLTLSIHIHSALSGELVTSLKQTLLSTTIAAGKTGVIEVTIPQLSLRPGDYRFNISVADPDYAKTFDVLDENVDLPILSVAFDDSRVHEVGGYVTIPASVSVR